MLHCLNTLLEIKYTCDKIFRCQLFIKKKPHYYISLISVFILYSFWFCQNNGWPYKLGGEPFLPESSKVAVKYLFSLASRFNYKMMFFIDVFFSFSSSFHLRLLRHELRWERDLFWLSDHILPLCALQQQIWGLIWQLATQTLTTDRLLFSIVSYGIEACENCHYQQDSKI